MLFFLTISDNQVEIQFMRSQLATDWFEIEHCESSKFLKKLSATASVYLFICLFVCLFVCLFERRRLRKVATNKLLNV